MVHINSLVPELWCFDFDKSLKFYTEVLGFTVTQRRGNDPHAYLTLQGSQIMIAWWKLNGPEDSWMPAPFEPPLGRGVNFQFIVDNVHKTYRDALSAGVKPFVDLHTSWIWRTDRMDEREQFLVLDPDGYLLRFVQIKSHRPIEPSDNEKLDRIYAQRVD